MRMQIQLDALGGVAGDMFLAAMLDAFPDLEAGVLASIAAVLGEEARCRLVEHNDGVFRGRRFLVEEAAGHHHPDHHPDSHDQHGHDHHHHDGHDHHHHHDQPHDHDHDHDHDHGHDHRDWTVIRGQLQAAPLDPSVRAHAVAIFAHLAEAEARVHGVTPEEVRFHEVGAVDSIADIVGAAHVIALSGVEDWTVSALPQGSGRVRTAHGLMPVPAPATTLLLEGFAFVDDGAPGERVTPTGAAILRHLCDPAASSVGKARTLKRSGVGFGARTLPGVSNCLRVLVFEAGEAACAWDEEALSVIEFEIDDQPAEDLAVALDRLRALPAVIDAVQTPVFGKKGRMVAAVRLLARTDGVQAVCEAVFRETTTLGLRMHEARRAVLRRREQAVRVDGGQVRVKTAERPGGATAKAEVDDAQALGGHAARSGLRRAAEQAALAGDDPK
ncbi:MAG TPA: LarC family nickel insertion protein [Caulobacteraceae bacterium]|jgi:hypothetical protein